MENIRLFVDFGSTFTKVCAVDIDQSKILGWEKAPSTVETNVIEGLLFALYGLQKQVNITQYQLEIACGCSSAAGGLRAVCIGLTQELTGLSARLAAYGAGAKVVGMYHGRLTEREGREIEALAPDVILLSGGTDGGNTAAVLANAETLCSHTGASHVIYCGNKSARDQVTDLFAAAGREIVCAENVLPTLEEIRPEDVNRKVRDLFLSHITRSKGILEAQKLIGRILMPTPSAVLAAAELLADGTKNEPGLGELMLVDVGGATTDVYSVCDGQPTIPGVNPVGLRQNRVKRTVEGDLGLYHNLDVLARAAEERGEHAEAEALHRKFGVPGASCRADHVALTRTAVRIGAERHCGVLEPIVTGDGVSYVQRGKDLTKVPILIGAGGPLVFSDDPRAALSGALRTERDKLMPENPTMLLDQHYILFAAGLLSQTDPDAALRMMKRYLTQIER